MAYRVSISSTELVTRAEVLAYAKIENTDENTIIDDRRAKGRTCRAIGVHLKGYVVNQPES